ncbi:alpha-ketoglutarate-dependent dioxygenase AlkB [Streptomyces sp. NPDC087440]|uniref:alpha-ketoglutarate-dependent dioxygenase AlkB n=1 Tax=Streptomyces sp. NPDC087440 TaxID=3365790 RepID=UPI0038214EDC
MPPASRITDQFRACALPIERNPFPELSAAALWEDTGKGRLGGVLTRVDATGGVPLVRTTTQYANPAQHFQQVHTQLADQIREFAALPVAFNNALIECYTNTYRTMGSHSDQALDLADGSFIAVFSCYQHPETGPLRKLVVEAKEADGERAEIPLAHNGFVVFSVAANRRHRHKIVLDTSGRAPDQAPDNQWLGLTFRTSKTLVHYRDGQAYLPEGTPLTSADDEQRRAFYRLRRRENTETDFAYPQLAHTVSESDLVPPVHR